MGRRKRATVDKCSRSCWRLCVSGPVCVSVCVFLSETTRRLRWNTVFDDRWHRCSRTDPARCHGQVRPTFMNPFGKIVYVSAILWTLLALQRGAADAWTIDDNVLEATGSRRQRRSLGRPPVSPSALVPNQNGDCIRSAGRSAGFASLPEEYFASSWTSRLSLIPALSSRQRQHLPVFDDRWHRCSRTDPARCHGQVRPTFMNPFGKIVYVSAILWTLLALQRGAADAWTIDDNGLLVSFMEAWSMLIMWSRTANHRLCWLSVNCSRPSLLFKSRKREREGYEGPAEQMGGPQAYHWQVASDVKSDEHQSHKKIRGGEEESRDVGLVYVQTGDELPGIIFHFIWRRAASRVLKCAVWTPLSVQVNS
ncbi:hypothetical protein ISCGN_032056 [Ixodes scapularis]